MLIHYNCWIFHYRKGIRPGCFLDCYLHWVLLQCFN